MGSIKPIPSLNKIMDKHYSLQLLFSTMTFKLQQLLSISPIFFSFEPQMADNILKRRMMRVFNSSRKLKLLIKTETLGISMSNQKSRTTQGATQPDIPSKYEKNYMIRHNALGPNLVIGKEWRGTAIFSAILKMNIVPHFENFSKIWT